MNNTPGNTPGNLLIVFYRNPELGKVKTRLAATLGDVRALQLYTKMVEYTRKVIKYVSADIDIYYSDSINVEDEWSNERYQKQLQSGEDLGQKMLSAFAQGFKNGYGSICIIGTDCVELTTTDIKEAFEKLKFFDVVLGPAKDGGYYLLGMNQLYSKLFENKPWGTSGVTTKTINDLRDLRLNYYKLRELNDVDEESDLPSEFINLR